jgi:hypothetical protein
MFSLLFPTTIASARTSSVRMGSCGFSADASVEDYVTGADLGLGDTGLGNGLGDRLAALWLLGLDLGSYLGEQFLGSEQGSGQASEQSLESRRERGFSELSPKPMTQQGVMAHRNSLNPICITPSGWHRSMPTT